MKYQSLIMISVLICTILSCSKNDQKVINEIEPTIDIKASKGISESYGIYIGEKEFVVNIPETGDYHLEYVTASGTDIKNILVRDTFNLIFHVQDSVLIFISLDSLQIVQYATITEVIISNSSVPHQGSQISESLVLYFTTDNSIPWEDISQKPGTMKLLLVEDEKVVPSDEFIILKEEEVYPEEQICIGEHTLANSYNLFACQLGGGSRIVASGGWYWIRMSIGFEEENGEEAAKTAKPDISLPVSMDGESLTMADTTIVEYNMEAGFWEVNAYYCTGKLDAGTYRIVGESYNKEQYVDRATCIFTVR